MLRSGKNDDFNHDVTRNLFGQKCALAECYFQTLPSILSEFISAAFEMEIPKPARPVDMSTAAILWEYFGQRPPG